MRLDPIRPVFDHDGPFLTIHAEVGRTGEDALDQLDARWTSIRHDLEHHDVDGRLIDDIGERLREKTGTPGEARRTIVATPHEVVFDDVQAGHALWPETVDHAELPDLAGWVRGAEAAIPFLLVTVDRTGGDLELYRAVTGGPERSETVQGESFQITKVPQGDWAQQEYQRRAEGLWERNAREVAEVVHSIVRNERPEAVLVSGDVRAVQELADHLDVPNLVRLKSGGRAEGTSDEALWQEIRTVLAELEAHAQQELADRLAEGAGRRAGVALGPDQVLGALVQGQVDQVVVDLDRVREVPVYPTDYPGLELPEPAGRAVELPADRVLVAAAARTGADLAVLPESLMPDVPITALLRWDPDAPPAG